MALIISHSEKLITKYPKTIYFLVQKFNSHTIEFDGAAAEMPHIRFDEGWKNRERPRKKKIVENEVVTNKGNKIYARIAQSQTSKRKTSKLSRITVNFRIDIFIKPPQQYLR